MSKLSVNPTKKQKKEEPEDETPEVDPALLKLYEKLDEIEERIEAINDEEAKEILQVQHKYALKAQPAMKERNEVIKGIPGFWKQVLINHPQLAEAITEDDEEIFEQLEEVDVDQPDVEKGYTIRMKFKPNKYFKNTEIKCTVSIGEEADGITHTPVEWKSGQNLEEKDDECFFVGMLADAEVLELFRDDIYTNATKYYHGTIELEEIGHHC